MFLGLWTLDNLCFEIVSYDPLGFIENTHVFAKSLQVKKKKILVSVHVKFCFAKKNIIF